MDQAKVSNSQTFPCSVYWDAINRMLLIVGCYRFFRRRCKTEPSCKYFPFFSGNVFPVFYPLWLFCFCLVCLRSFVFFYVLLWLFHFHALCPFPLSMALWRHVSLCPWSLWLMIYDLLVPCLLYDFKVIILPVYKSRN